MKQVQNILTVLYVSTLLFAVVLMGGFALEILPRGFAAGHSQAEFVAMTAMELLTLLLAYLALRLFKFGRVLSDLKTHGPQALRRWGVLRWFMLSVPMQLNALFYGAFLSTTFFYLAVILLICVAFVWPSAARCQSEVEA